MASQRTQVGPWPIKRSQSVPDASIRIFTPRNSPPSLARLLGQIDEEHSQSHGKACFNDSDRAQTEVFTCYGDDKRSSWTFRVGVGIGWVQCLVVSGAGILLVAPAAAAYVFASPGRESIRVARSVPSSVWLYLLISLVSMVVGMIVVIALFSLNLVKHKRSLGRQRTQTMLLSAVAGGIVMTAWTLFIVQPRIRHE